MTIQVDLSGRGPSRRGLRIRGIAMVVAVAVSGWGLAEWTRQPADGRVSIRVVASGVGDGVDTSTGVRLHGLQVGEVRAIQTVGRSRVLTLDVDQARLADLSTTMVTRFVSATAFGTTAIELIPRAGGNPLRPGSTVDYSRPLDDFTVTKVLRSSESVITDLLTPQLSGALNNAADLMVSSAPAATAALTALRAWRDSDPVAVNELLRIAAKTLAPMGRVSAASVEMLHGLLDIADYNDPHKVDLAAAALDGFSTFTFGFFAGILAATSPMGPSMDMMLDYLGPMTYALRNVDASDVAALIRGVDGAFKKERSGTVALNTEVIVKAFPAVGVPLTFARGGGR